MSLTTTNPVPVDRERSAQPPGQRQLALVEPPNFLMPHTFARRLVLLTFIVGSAWVGAAPRNEFFAMDTIARGEPADVAAMLKELGYDGLGGRAYDETMLPALTARGLKFFNGYFVLNLKPADQVPDEKLERWFAAMANRNVFLWLAIRSVQRVDGTAYPISDDTADAFVVERLRGLAKSAARQGVKISLYPHTGSWLARVEDALRLAGKIDRADVSVTFNLCHWLKVEGAERDPFPVLKMALPRLTFVTINGADEGDTRTLPWPRVIQPMDSGTYDLRAFVGRLQALGYTGPIGFQGYGIKGDSREILARSLKAWKSW